MYTFCNNKKNSYRVSGREVSDDAVLRWGYGTEYSLDGGHVIYAGQWEVKICTKYRKQKHNFCTL